MDSLKKQGKKNRSSGARFELKVRKNLEKKGWIVDKWTNNFDLVENKIIPAKRKFNPFKKVIGLSSGFPDFIVYRPIVDSRVPDFRSYKLIAVESKSNGFLDKIERAKCTAFLENGVFSKILVASKGKKRGEVIYKDSQTKEIFEI